MVWGITSEGSRPGLLLTTAQNERSGSRGWLGLVGKVYKLLQKVKTKYLAVSPVMDIYERLFRKQPMKSQSF